MRLLSLVFGLSSIIAATFLRARLRLLQHVPLVALAGYISVCLLLLPNFKAMRFGMIKYSSYSVSFALFCFGRVIF